MSYVDFSIQSAAGTIPLVSEPGIPGTYRLMTGTVGFGMVPDQVRYSASASGGGWYRGHRVGMRTPTLVIEINAADRADMNVKLRALADVVDADNSPQLVAAITGDDTYRMAFQVTDTDPNSYGDSGERVTDWTLGCTVPRPYWVADTPYSINVTQGAAVPGIVPDLAELPVSASAAFGVFNIENKGDAPAPITWVITGPGGPTTVTVGGKTFTYNAVLSAADVITITRTALGWTVTDQTGANKYASLVRSPPPKFPSAPRGVSPAVVTMASTTTASRVQGFFNPLRKVVF